MAEEVKKENGAVAANQPQILGVVFMGVLMSALDIAIVGPALPAIKAEFNLTDRILPWILNAYFLMNLAGRPALGKLSDILGRRMVLASSAVLYGLGALITALSPSFALLMVGRALQGFGAGGIFPVASAAVTDFLPAEKRGRILHIIGTTGAFIFIVGLPLGSLLMALGWRWIFGLGVPVAFVVALASISSLPSTPRAKVKPFDLVGLVLLIILMSFLAMGLNLVEWSNPVASFKTIQVWPLFLIAAIIYPIFKMVEARAEEPSVRPKILGNWRMALGAHIALGTGLLQVGIVFMPLFVVVVLGIRDYMAGLMLLPLVAAMALATPLFNTIGGKTGTRIAITGGALMASVGYLMLGLFTPGNALFYLASSITGAGIIALLGPSLRHKAISNLPAVDHPTAQRVMYLYVSMGRLLGAAAIGAIAASGKDIVVGYRNAFAVLGVLSGVIALGSLLLTTGKSPDAPPAPATPATPPAKTA
jgi:MFS family permease